MISNTYAKAYVEVLEILKYFPKKDYMKIPEEKIEFYKNNKDKNYIFTINPKVDLSKQNISREANAIIVNLYRDYFATEEQKLKIKEILELNQRKEEQEKRKKYKQENLFRRNDKYKATNTEPSANNTMLVEYKESILTRIRKAIFKFLHIK